MAEELVKRVLPHSIEAEQSVLGCCLYNSDAIIAASETLRGKDFYQYGYGVMFDTLVEMVSAGRDTDIVSLQNELRRKDVSPETYDIENLRGLLTGSYVSANIRAYAKIVKEKSQLRELIATTESLTESYYQGKESTEKLLGRTESEIFNILQTRTDRDHEDITTIVTNTIKIINETAQNGGPKNGVPSGYVDLDNMLLGFHPSQLIILGGRPGMGKTAFALNIALHMGTKAKKKVALFELEMTREELVTRFLAMQGNVDSQKLRSGKLADADWDDIINAAGVIAKSGIIIDDTPGLSMSELRTRCKRYQLEEGLDCVIVDYIGLMQLSGNSNMSLVNQIGELSRSLKLLARELNVPIIALSQLSRAPDQRKGDNRPQMSDLRDSGSLEQDADVILFVYRDEQYNHDTEDKGIAEIIVAKQRAGRTGSVKLKWQADLTKFYSLATERKNDTHLPKADE